MTRRSCHEITLIWHTSALSTKQENYSPKWRQQQGVSRGFPVWEFYHKRAGEADSLITDVSTTFSRHRQSKHHAGGLISQYYTGLHTQKAYTHSGTSSSQCVHQNALAYINAYMHEQQKRICGVVWQRGVTFSPKMGNFLDILCFTWK